MGILAFALDALWNRRNRWRHLATATMAISAAMFVGFYPIISGAPLPTKEFYNVWMWFPNWR
jgi:dolichyl-phosphate-mannose--protein O-mannosyl transferase